MKQTCGDCRIRHPVDENEPSKIAIFAVRFEDDRLTELNTAHANIVDVEFLGCDVFQGIDIDLVFERRDRRRDRLRPDLHEVRAALQHRAVMHPYDGGFELIGNSPEEFSAQLKRDIDVAGRLVKAAKIEIAD